jgi:hypothetical protein
MFRDGLCTPRQYVYIISTYILHVHKLYFFSHVICANFYKNWCLLIDEEGETKTLKSSCTKPLKLGNFEKCTPSQICR